MTPWQEFYANVKDPSWPDCEKEVDFQFLPAHIQDECYQHGYDPKKFRNLDAVSSKTFPIKTDTACQLKWNWSTVYLSTGLTASCHRTNHHPFDFDTFDFHNTEQKIQDRNRMLKGQWPQTGCDYCRDIELAGGQSDRITNLNLPGINPPLELETDPTATRVTPRILEVYFDNTCNLKCVYCGPYFSSLWVSENDKWGDFSANGVVLKSGFKKNSNFLSNKKKLWQWLEHNGKDLTNFNFLGGEPLFQKELDECLEFFQQNPFPDLNFQIFTNLNATPERLKSVISKIELLWQQRHIKKFTVTASIDCWGPEQEYARYPLKIDAWKTNFEYLISQDWINIVVGSTVTPLTIWTMDQLIDRLNHWRGQREIHHYFNSVNAPSYMCIDIFGDLMKDAFQSPLSKLPQESEEQKQVWNYLDGIAKESSSKPPNIPEVLKLQTFLDEMDRRRNTNWRSTYPSLDQNIKKILAI